MAAMASRAAHRQTPDRQTRRPRRGRRPPRYWVRTVTTVSTAPPAGLFTRDARTIARALASKRVSPNGPTSGLRMLLFYINRAGRQLSRRQRAELLKAKRFLQDRIAERRPGR
jgi:tRNA(adenine34) deaminase